MTFNSAVFVVFLGVFLAGWCALSEWRHKKRWLLVAGLVFYGWFNPWYLGLVFLTTTIDFVCVRAMAAAGDERRRRAAMIMSVVSNLTVLGLFKYYDFFARNVSGVLDAIGLLGSLPLLELMLPIGISFYAFEAISYSVDVYRGRTVPARSYSDLLLFITFFPHLVAGPIVRARDFLPQLDSPRRPSRSDVLTGLQWIVVGYFLKIGVADNLASSVDRVFDAPESASTSDAWLASTYFAFQIFGDFAGYSSIARGLAKIIGFELTPNFDLPYLARGFSEFWRRWHISLSSWLRDYLYISLGGSRGGRVATYRNLLVTMLLGGLWHGAAWTFVVWGALHGAYLVVEHAVRARFPRILPEARRPGTVGAVVDVGQMVVTFLLVLVAWVFFRAASLDDATDLVRKMLLPSHWHPTAPAKRLLVDGVWLVPVVVMFAYGWLRQRGWELRPAPLVQGIALGILAFVTLICREVSDAFIYFQF